MNSNTGEINLRPDAGELGGDLVKGNVYFDDQPVCDDDWGQEEAKVACRLVFLFPPRNYTLTKTMAKRTLQNCDARAVSHSFNVFLLSQNAGIQPRFP